MKRTLVIFDCFGVIIGEIAPFIFRKYFSEEEAIRVKEEVCRPADLGLLTESEIYDAIGAAVGESGEYIRAEYVRMTRLNEAMPPIIKKLSENADVAMLSNAMHGFARRVLEKFSLTELFDKVFLSCEHGIMKPNPEYYRLCVDSFGKEYDRIFMIDDNPANLEPLSDLGITGILFESEKSVTEHPQLKRYFAD